MQERKKYLIITAVFLVIYFLFLNYNLVTDLGYDEARHANQGFIIYDYFNNLLDGNFLGFRSFIMDQYITKYHGMDWYAFYDPPVHAISQAIVFKIISPSQYTARLTTMLWTLAGAFLIFFLAERVFNSSKKGFITTALFLLFPITYDFARQSMLTIPIAITTAGWFYFFFYRKGWIGLFLSTLFLLLGGLMKYQTFIFAGVFFLAYLIYNIVLNIKQENNLLNNQKTFIKKILIQLGLCILLSLPWILMSFYETGVLIKLLEAGTVEIKGSSNPILYQLYFFILSFTKTAGVILLALVPIIFFKDSKLIKEHPHILIFILTTFITATLLISNKQFRYMIHVLPFIAILCVEGLFILINKINYKHTFKLAIGTIFIFLVIININTTNAMVNDYGIGNPDIWEHLDQARNPKLIILLNVGFEETKMPINYYYSEDLHVFKTLLFKENSNPELMQQSVMRGTLSPNKDYQEAVSRLINTFNFFPVQVDTYAIISKPAFYSETGKNIANIFAKYNFTGKEFEQYILLIKRAQGSRIKFQPFFPNKENLQKALRFKRLGIEKYGQKQYRSAAQFLTTSFRLNPFDAKTGAMLSRSLNAEAEILVSKGKKDQAQKLFSQALEVTPTYERARKNLNKIINLLKK